MSTLDPACPIVFQDTQTCVLFVEKYLELHTNYNYKTLDAQELQRFGLQNDPHHISLHDWIVHLIEHTSPSVAVLAALYIRRALYPEHQDLLTPVRLPGLSAQNRHRVFFMAMIIASKYLMDVPYSMKAWAKIGLHCWTVESLCDMEKKVLRKMQWNLYIHPVDLNNFADNGCRYINENDKK
eukprot:TRINITY_DN12204_c0_g1::TRINITY_DN12204_c0_g1_i1::g.26545::m.26545 TRINITY_DN12204_c0_g1::TRINITY_DN12204_c0_g1_i1::g.26545  ORF type:complete len:182 (-),score=17.37,Cyclin_N/PF00134.18/9.8e-10,Cyclin/PF08613.6/1.2e-06 TRINITY_DN12204_c0_g1_i1:20-565(-)